MSHALPSGDLAELVERAVDALIEQETHKRFGARTASGAGKSRKVRELKFGSRHVPVETERAMWERDNSQCTVVDGEGRRCAERRFLTLERRRPFALGGPSTLENLCLLCTAHTLENGLARKEASAAIGQALASEPGLDVEHLLRRCLLLLIPKAG